MTDQIIRGKVLITACAGGSPFHNSTQYIDVEAKYNLWKNTACVHGDPHYIFLDDTVTTWMDFFREGTFYYVQESRGLFEIQIKTLLCSGEASCVNEVFLRFGTSTLAFRSAGATDLPKPPDIKTWKNEDIFLKGTSPNYQVYFGSKTGNEENSLAMVEIKSCLLALNHYTDIHLTVYAGFFGAWNGHSIRNGRAMNNDDFESNRVPDDKDLFKNPTYSSWNNKNLDCSAAPVCKTYLNSEKSMLILDSLSAAFKDENLIRNTASDLDKKTAQNKDDISKQNTTDTLFQKTAAEMDKVKNENALHNMDSLTAAQKDKIFQQVLSYNLDTAFAGIKDSADSETLIEILFKASRDPRNSASDKRAINKILEEAAKIFAKDVDSVGSAKLAKLLQGIFGDSMSTIDGEKLLAVLNGIFTGETDTDSAQKISTSLLEIITQLQKNDPKDPNANKLLELVNNLFDGSNNQQDILDLIHLLKSLGEDDADDVIDMIKDLYNSREKLSGDDKRVLGVIDLLDSVFDSNSSKDDKHRVLSLLDETFRKDATDSHDVVGLLDDIFGQGVSPFSDEESRKEALLKLNKLFADCKSESCKDALSILKDVFPNTSLSDLGDVGEDYSNYRDIFNDVLEEEHESNDYVSTGYDDNSTNDDETESPENDDAYQEYEAPDGVLDVTPEQATSLCSSLIPLNDCNLMVDRNMHIHTCVYDVLKTKSLEFAGSSISSYLAKCRSYVHMMERNPTRHDLVKKIKSSTGMAGYDCPDKCSGRGQCTDIGCICAGGYLGETCAHMFEDLKNATYVGNLLTATPELKATVVIDPSATTFTSTQPPFNPYAVEAQEIKVEPSSAKSMMSIGVFALIIVLGCWF